jgi:hypothetical protein
MWRNVSRIGLNESVASAFALVARITTTHP